MKKTILFLLLLFLVVSCLFFILREEEVGIDPSHFLPATTSIYLEHRDLEESINFFHESRLGKTFESINYEKLFREFDIYESHYPAFVDFRNEVNDFLNSQLYKQLLSKKVVVSFIPYKDEAIGSPLSEIKKRLLFILEPKLSSSIIDLISSLNLEGTKQTSTKYGGRTIKIHHLEDGEKLATTKVDELILVSFNEELIRKSLDRFNSNNKQSLYDNQEFMEHRGLHDNFQIFFYSSVQSIRKQIPVVIDKLDSTEKQLITKQLKSWEGWKTASFSMQHDTEQVYDKAIVFFDEEKLDKQTRKLLLIPPQNNDTLETIPSNVVSYFWTNTLDLKTIWQTVLAEDDLSKKERKEMVADFKKGVGVDPEKLFNMTGNQFGFTIMEGTGISFIPLPELAVFFEIKKPKAIHSLIQRRLKELNIPLQTLNYKKKKLIYWSNAIQNSLQPVYCIYGDFLFIASTVELLKKIIDTKDSGSGLLQDPEFLSVSNGQLEGKSNSVSFVRFSSFIQLAKELVNWGGIVLGLQDRRVAHRSKLLIDHLINPLLDGMMMFSTVHTRSYSTNDSVFFENIARLQSTQPEQNK